MMQPNNITAVLIAAVAAWIFGAIYYTVFSKAWIAARGETMESLKAKMEGKSGLAKVAPFIISFIAEIVMASALQGILFHSGMNSVRQGIIAGALIWLGFVLTTLGVNNAYQGNTLKHTAIDLAHWLGVLVIIGAIIGYGAA